MNVAWTDKLVKVLIHPICRHLSANYTQNKWNWASGENAHGISYSGASWEQSKLSLISHTQNPTGANGADRSIQLEEFMVRVVDETMLVGLVMAEQIIQVLLVPSDLFSDCKWRWSGRNTFFCQVDSSLRKVPHHSSGKNG
jgi:hypothetical protein